MSLPSRVAVELPKSYRLMNHGPTVLVSSAHAGRRNVMAAAWSMPLDFDPPKVAVVIDKTTWTRELVEASGSFAINIPCVDQARLALSVGGTSGRALDKFSAYGLQASAAQTVEAPLLDGCIAWLECRVLHEPNNEQRHDLFIGEVTAAWADPRVFSNGHWVDLPADSGLRTLHYVAGGRFFGLGPAFDVSPLAPPGSAKAQP